jgi:hypothetical protein
MQETLVSNQQFKIFQRGEKFSLYVTDKSNRKNQRRYTNNKPCTEM